MATLWDKHGTPLQPHGSCPNCGDADEVGSHFDAAWCHACGWVGNLEEMRERASDASGKGKR